MSSRHYPIPTKGAHVKPGERHHPRRLLATLIATGLASLALVAPAPVAAAAPISNVTPQIGIVPFSGDVFTVDQEGNLIAVGFETPTSAPLYNLAGDPLNLTWGQFSSATAKSVAWNLSFRGTTYTQFLIALSGLVPHGVYSLFYRTFGPESNNAFCPNVEPSVALTAAIPQLQKPDPDSFVASSSGNALFFASVAQNLLAAQQLQVSVIYHFNGKTYGPVANEGESEGPVHEGHCRSSYGIDAMRQFIIIYK